MPVHRTQKNRNFTVMSNFHLRDKRLSLKATGLFSVMLSLPESWNYSVSGLSCIFKEGKTAIRSALSELEKYGYVMRHEKRDADGKFDGIFYEIYEMPSDTANEAAAEPKEETSCPSYKQCPADAGIESTEAPAQNIKQFPCGTSSLSETPNAPDNIESPKIHTQPMLHFPDTAQKHTYLPHTFLPPSGFPLATSKNNGSEPIFCTVYITQK